jgi:ribosome recycling factor
MESEAVKKQLREVVTWLEKEYLSIRTGQATPTLLDGVKVESYGSFMPINQVASVGTEDARTLRISPWDSTIVSKIEKAITDANLGVSLATDSAGVRVIFPELTGERRQQLVKLAKSKLEEARVSVRKIRDTLMKEVDQIQKNGDISEDEKFSRKEFIQSQVDATNKLLEAHFVEKETVIAR